MRQGKERLKNTLTAMKKPTFILQEGPLRDKTQRKPI